MQCHLEFSLAHWQYYFKYIKNCLCIVFSFIFDIAHISVCSTGAMAHFADVSAVDITTMFFSFFVVVQGQNGFVQHPHTLCQSGGRGFFDIEFLSIMFDMCFHITIFDVQFLLTE